MKNAVNTTDTPRQDRYESLMAKAVDALTDAIRTVEDDGRKLDFGGFLSHALMTAAANVGGVHHLTEGRPASWEAADVRHLAGGDMADLEWLAPYRTVPVIVGLNIDEAIERMGQYDPDRRKWVPATENYFDQLTRIDNQLSHAIDDDPDDEAAWAEYESAAKGLERRWNRRYERYATAFAKAVRDKATELRITAPTYVEVVTDPELWSSNDMPQNPELYGADDQIVATLWETAFEMTPTALLSQDGIEA